MLCEGAGRVISIGDGEAEEQAMRNLVPTDGQILVMVRLKNDPSLTDVVEQIEHIAFNARHYAFREESDIIDVYKCITI
jgi:metal-dependent amidase/aminoacylase/carboxypeptidase family protein